MDFIRGLMAEPEVGKVYKGMVKTIVDFGAFVEYLPGKDGLLHISELEHFRVGNVEDVLQVGDEVEVKLVEIDSRTGKVRLSRKALLPVPEGMENMPRDDRPRDRDRDGGGRGGGPGRTRRRRPRRPALAEADEPRSLQERAAAPPGSPSRRGGPADASRCPAPTR